MNKFSQMTLFSVLAFSVAALGDTTTPPVTAPKAPQKHKVAAYVTYPPRVLSVEIRYQDQAAATKASLEKISKSLKTMVGAYKAIPIGDQYYQTRLFSSKISPYVPGDLYQKVVRSQACNLNTVVPCIVVEKDTITGKTEKRAYFLAAAPSPKSNTMSVARVDIDKKKYAKEIDELLANESNGIYVYSAAANSAEAQELNGTLVDVDQAPTPVTAVATPAPYVSNASYLLAKNVKIEGLKTEEDKMAYWQSVEALVKASTYVRAEPLPPAAMNSCWVKADMVQTRAFFLVDVVGLIRGDKTPSRISTKATLNCELADGVTVQKVNVKVKEYSRVRIGFAFSPGRQKSLSMGLGGFANDALDVLTIHDFASIAQGCMDVPLFSACYAPVVLSNQPGRDAVLASTPSVNVGQMNLNATLSLGDTMTIEGDFSR